jgi:hypothetical protein
MRDFNNLIKKVIFDKNGHQKTVYVRMVKPNDGGSAAGEGARWMMI